MNKKYTQPMIPISAILPISVEAIRSVTGCPDVENNGLSLVDELQRIARAAAGQIGTQASIATANQPATRDLPALLERLRFALGDPDGTLTDSQLVRRGHELRQKAAKWETWTEALDEIETQMPEGWRFVLDCSPGDWSLSLLDPDGNDVEFDRDCDNTAQMINSAIETARAAVAKDARKELK
jgi:hypothetical protein